MAIMTISIQDKTAQELRQAVIARFGKKKGVLGEAIEEAIREWLEEEQQLKIAERQMKLMKKGIGTLNGWKFNREELYDRVK